MKILEESYSTKLSWPIWLSLFIIILITVLELVYFAFGIFGTSLLPKSETLGPQGDFMGGHLASIIGSITLIVVLITGYLQIQQDRRFRLREMFLNGISAISSYDVKNPGTEQAMRILDYLSLVAFRLNDDELFLILNTVITKEIRGKLEEIEHGDRREYPNAIAARHKIGTLLEAHYKSINLSKPKNAA